MTIRVQVIKVYDVETEGGDTLDSASIDSHCELVQKMQSTEIEEKGKLVNVSVEFAEAVGPSDDWMDWLDKTELMKRLSQDSK